MAVHRSLDMSLTREEFLRLLPAAVGLETVTLENDCLVHANASKGWRIGLTRLPDLRLGSVVLPLHRVELAFDGFSQQDIQAFMARFERHFQRGGG
jgi:hypothetical protein